MKLNLSFFGNDNNGDDATPEKAGYGKKTMPESKTNDKSTDTPVISVTQKELNELIKGRLARERNKLLPQAADYEAFKSWQENQTANAEAQKQVAAQLDSMTNENAHLKKKLCAIEMGIDSSTIDFAVFQAERMVSEELEFNDALELLIMQQPHIFSSLRNINTGVKHSMISPDEGNAALREKIFVKMGVRGN